MASLQFVVGAALAMLLVVGLSQLIAYQFTRGAVLTALERGVRAGAVVGGGVDECRRAVDDSLSQVLGGEVGEGIEAECRAEGDLVLADANGSVPAWLPGAPDLRFELETMARLEPPP